MSRKITEQDFSEDQFGFLSADDKVYRYLVNNGPSGPVNDLGGTSISATLVKNDRDLEAVSEDFTVTNLEAETTLAVNASDVTLTLSKDLNEGCVIDLVQAVSGTDTLTVTLEDDTTTTLNGGTADVTFSDAATRTIVAGPDGNYYVA